MPKYIEFQKSISNALLSERDKDAALLMKGIWEDACYKERILMHVLKYLTKELSIDSRFVKNAGKITKKIHIYMVQIHQ